MTLDDCRREKLDVKNQMSESTTLRYVNQIKVIFGLKKPCILAENVKRKNNQSLYRLWQRR